MKDYHVTIANKNLKYLELVHIPSHLFHYSGKETCDLISSTCTLRAYDLHSMKDKNEFWHGLELFNLIVKRKKLKQHLGSISEFVKNEIEVNKTIRFFLTCFTTSKEYNRHWRTYGDNFKGDCLRFNKLGIKLNPKHHRLGPNNAVMNTFQISPVNYSRNVQEKLFSDLIEDYKKLHDEIFILHGKDGRPHIQQLLLGVFQCVVVFCTLFKDKKYSWENEYRGLSCFTEGDPLDCASGRKYVELDIRTIS